MEAPSQAFDLDIWAANYDGVFLPLRYAHVATLNPSLARTSLALALAATKKGKDVQLYNRLHELAAARGIHDLSMHDPAWASRQEEANRRELARLEGELRGYKNNLIRESIRMGQEDLAMFLLNTGGPPPDPSKQSLSSHSGYSTAYDAFSKLREYCTTPTHIASMTLHLLLTAVLQAVSAQQTNHSPVTHYASVLANSNRLRSVGVKEEEQVKLIPIMHAMTGIAHLGMGHYREAATAFIATPQDYTQIGAVYGTDFGRTVATGNDLAIYGGLCALATMSRDELQTQVLGGSFRVFLELEPHVRKAISLFVTAKYQACLATLTRYAVDWNLDVFLGATSGQGEGKTHINDLLAAIREKSITSYFSSFSKVSLQSLAATFPPLLGSVSSTPAEAMEREVLLLIQSGVLKARLDAVAGELVAPYKDDRAAAVAAATNAAEDVERTLLLRLQKVNMAMAGLEIPKPKGAQKWMVPQSSMNDDGGLGLV